MSGETVRHLRYEGRSRDLWQGFLRPSVAVRAKRRPFVRAAARAGAARLYEPVRPLWPRPRIRPRPPGLAAIPGWPATHGRYRRLDLSLLPHRPCDVSPPSIV